MQYAKHIYICLILLVLLSVYQVYSVAIPIAAGNFQLYLNQNNSVGVRIQDNYLAIQLTTVNSLNGSSSIILYQDKGIMSFHSNTNGSIQIFTNFQKVKYQINDNDMIQIQDLESFNFLNGDFILISFGFGSVIFNALLGLIGVIIFCITPILSYKLSDDAKNKFKFMFILIPLLVISFGLVMSFIYSGI